MVHKNFSAFTIAFLFLGIILSSLITPVLGNGWQTANAQRSEGVQLDTELKPDYAVDVVPSSESNNQDDRTDSVNLILQLVAGSLIYIAGPIAIIIIAVGGLLYVLSHGDPTKMEEAKKTIIYAVVGLIVIILSWAIMSNVIRILSV